VTPTPDHELDLLINTVAAATDLARAGELVEGHAELVYALRRMVGLRDAPGSPEWTITLATRYALAVASYCYLYGPKLT
jgi:hypothetical protein